MPVVMVGSALGVFAYIIGRPDYSRYLLFPYIPGAGELLIFCAAMAGAGLAFLWFNTHPAQVFMRTEKNDLLRLELRGHLPGELPDYGLWNILPAIPPRRIALQRAATT